MRSVESAMESSVLASKGVKFGVEESFKQRRIFDTESSFRNPYPPDDSQDRVCGAEVTSCFDWIEKEMAKVCGEENKNPDVSKDELQPTQPCSESENAQTAIFNAIGNKSATHSLKFNWKSLRKRNEAELKRKLAETEKHDGVEKIAKIEKRFLELFGPDDVTTDILTSKKKDEIAAFTVKHLMPIYKRQRISSKDLFKKLARHIAQQTMEKFSFPDEKNVEAQVVEFFRDGKSVKSENDIYS